VPEALRLTTAAAVEDDDGVAGGHALGLVLAGPPVLAVRRSAHDRGHGQPRLGREVHGRRQLDAVAGGDARLVAPRSRRVLAQDRIEIVAATPPAELDAEGRAQRSAIVSRFHLPAPSPRAAPLRRAMPCHQWVNFYTNAGERSSPADRSGRGAV
jgi:hypothetical protein